ncbi:16116_t:CDS:2, partial [Dentiscutata heterogama]
MPIKFKKIKGIGMGGGITTPKGKTTQDHLNTVMKTSESVFLKDQDYESAIKSVESSLSKFQTSHADLMLIHSPKPDPQKRIETYNALQKLVRQKMVRSICVSNYDVNHLEELIRINGYSNYDRDTETFVLNGPKVCGNATCGIVTADSLSVGSHTTKA